MSATLGMRRAIGVPAVKALTLTLVSAALAFRLYRLTDRYAVNIFFWDQWDFNDATLFEHHSLWQIFRWQHGPHRQGLGGVLAALVEPWFDWNSRTEAFLATTLVVMAALCALYLKRRLFGSLAWTDAVIPMIILTPAQWASLWTTVNFAHGILPLLLMILYCLAWTCGNERAKFALVTGLNFALIYTGFGLFAGFLTPVLLIASYRRDRTAGARTYLMLCILASVASLASFFAGYRWDPASGCSSLVVPSAIRYFWFLDLMYSTPFGAYGAGILATSLGAVVLGLVTAAAVAGWWKILASRGTPQAVSLTPAILGTYSILFCVAAALGRTCLGLADAHASRYSNYMQIGILSLYFCALGLSRKRATKVLPVILLISLAPSLAVSRYDALGMQAYSNVKAAWRTCYLNGRDPADCDRAVGPVYPRPEETHLRKKLIFLLENGQNLFADSQ